MSANECPICFGFPHASGLPCICGGKNTMRDALNGAVLECHRVATARDTALRDLAQAREYITALSADCKRLEEDREYNAGLVTQARERVRVLEAERETLHRWHYHRTRHAAEGCYCEHGCVLPRLAEKAIAALSANPGDDDKRGAR